jgi:hypothetical protein
MSPLSSTTALTVEQQHANDLRQQLGTFESELASRNLGNQPNLHPEMHTGALVTAIKLTRRELADAALEIENIRRDNRDVSFGNSHRRSVQGRFRPGSR